MDIIDPSKCFFCKKNKPSLMETNFSSCEKHLSLIIKICIQCMNKKDLTNRCFICDPQKSLFIYFMFQQLDENTFCLPAYGVNTLPSLAKNENPMYLNLESTPLLICLYTSISKNKNNSFFASGGVYFPINQQPSILNSAYEMKITGFPEKVSYTNLPNLILPRYAHFGIVIGTKYMVIGGIVEKILNITNTCELLENSKSAWKSAPELNKKRSQLQGFILKNYLYVFGGFSHESTPEKTFERLDIKEINKWELIEVKNENLIKGWVGSEVIQEKDNIIIIGGSNGKELSNDILIFDEKENINTLGVMKEARANFSAILDEEKIIILGGNKINSIETIEYKTGKNISFLLDENSGWSWNQPGTVWKAMNDM